MSSSHATLPGEVVYIYTQQVGAGGSEIQDHPLLHSKVKASLGYVSPYVKKINYDNKFLIRGSRPSGKELLSICKERQ